MNRAAVRTPQNFVGVRILGSGVAAHLMIVASGTVIRQEMGTMLTLGDILEALVGSHDCGLVLMEILDPRLALRPRKLVRMRGVGVGKKKFQDVSQ